MVEKVEEKGFEEKIEEMKKRYNNYSRKKYYGYPNWDTWETILIMDNEENILKFLIAETLIKHIKYDDFDMERAKSFIEKYVVKQAIKKDPNINKENVDLEYVVLSLIISQY
jgi:hypothetical protein